MKVQESNSFTPKNGNPMLEEFLEISTPDKISWLPETLGWQIVVFLFALLILYRLYLKFKYYMDNGYRRWGIQQLELLSESTEDLQKLPILLKKTAIYAYKRENVAELTGLAFETWLDQECPQSEFSKTPISGLLNHLSYSPAPVLTNEQFNKLKIQISHWIKHHQGEL
ncbi:DUF4381 domain-containing protein [Thalassomonas sp. M1454]|uniref:DUF4381 domain-containing protein n=1 Tax=Thalassomonas sp. M1454 TaxID=2594477 RepID=UPI00117E292E|nr:DUF4381 domain-containing protein [Thalassomonas sp. M1454]TRX56492.1 DUF4381 domain-containing protein [Thalassomonas sp. M1454]